MKSGQADHARPPKCPGAPAPGGLRPTRCLPIAPADLPPADLQSVSCSPKEKKVASFFFKSPIWAS